MGEFKPQQKTGDSFAGNEKQEDVRRSNILACRGIADTIRTSLGPKGMDKMVIGSDKNVVITNDGATILKQLDVVHPAARMLVELSKSQDVEAGDGTTTVAIIAGSLLEQSERLMAKGIHPGVIASSFKMAAQKAEEILKEIAVPVDLSDTDSLVKSAITSLSSKVVAANASVLAPLAVEAVMRVIDPKTATNVDLNSIRLVTKLGGTIEDTELVYGLIFNQNAHHVAGGPTLIKNAKIGLIQFQLSATKSDVLEEAELSLHDALCVVRCLVKQHFLIPGGAAPEIEVAQRLAKFSDTLAGLDSYCMKVFAEALEFPSDA
eukprot:338762_1